MIPVGRHESQERSNSSLATWMSAREEVYRARAERVKSVCRKYSSSDHPVNDLEAKLDQFYLQRKVKAMGCLINKVASSSVVRSFLDVDGYNLTYDPLYLRSPHAFKVDLVPQSLAELEYAERTFFKFMVVRDPFERLHSCYRDKMVDNPHWSLANFRKTVKDRARRIIRMRSRIAQHLVEKGADLEAANKSAIERTKARWRRLAHLPGKSHFPRNETKFREASKATDLFPPTPQRQRRWRQKRRRRRRSPVDRVGRNWRRRRRNYSQEKNDEDDGGEPPTFTEFLEYILHEDMTGTGFSSHWVPYWRQCTPCNFDYNMIGKLETAMDDLTYLWKRSGLERTTPMPWENKSGSGVTAGSAAPSQSITAAFASVPLELLQRVSEEYKMDFEMFGYDFHDTLRKVGYAF